MVELQEVWAKEKGEGSRRHRRPSFPDIVMFCSYRAPLGVFFLSLSFSFCRCLLVPKVPLVSLLSAVLFVF